MQIFLCKNIKTKEKIEKKKNALGAKKHPNHTFLHQMTASDSSVQAGSGEEGWYPAFR